MPRPSKKFSDSRMPLSKTEVKCTFESYWISQNYQAHIFINRYRVQLRGNATKVGVNRLATKIENGKTLN